MAIESSLRPDPESHPKFSSSERPELPQDASPISPSSKGKAPMEEPSAADASEGDACFQAPSCGICLSEQGHAARGYIDSCDHYFCFLCIIEWSKIESRCPLCKGRFGSIRRMRKDGSFIGDRAVVVPVRDQIYDPQRNVTSGPIDPYSNISCNVCTGSTDENLMLLCDLCDTAVHTYCSGLGATVPEDDWFCEECAQMKAEEINSKPVPDVGTSPSTDHKTKKPSVKAPTSILDIVRGPREPGDPEVERLLTLFSPPQQQSLSSAIASRRGSSISINSEIRETESSVRTLNRCRDVNKYIRDLRENWNGLRSGSLSFGSRKVDSGATSNSRVDDSSHGHGFNRSYDVDRAWKMFDVAKSKQPQKVSDPSPSTSRSLSLKVCSSKDSKNLFLGASSKSVPSKPKSSTFSGLKMHQSFNKRSGQQNSCIVLGRENTTTTTTTTTTTSLVAAASPGKRIIPSNKNTQSKSMQESVKNNVFHGRAAMSSQQKQGQGSHVYHERVSSTCTKSLVGSLTGASGVSCIQKKPASLDFEVCSGQYNISDTKNTSESSQLHKSTRKRGNAESTGCERKRVKVDDEAKSEIQSLVKLNLKLLSAGKKLEVDLFKDIARRSTHEILAACGMESRIHNRLPIPKPNCCHDDQIKQQSKLTLMPSSCRECFYAFVKDVVSSVMSKKI